MEDGLRIINLPYQDISKQKMFKYELFNAYLMRILSVLAHLAVHNIINKHREQGWGGDSDDMN